MNLLYSPMIYDITEFVVFLIKDEIFFESKDLLKVERSIIS
jgi:hypothetical protein